MATQTAKPTAETFTGTKLAQELRAQQVAQMRAIIKNFEGEIKLADAENRATLADMREALRRVEGNGMPTSRAGNGHTATTKGPRKRASRARAATPAAPSKDEVLPRPLSREQFSPSRRTPRFLPSP